MAQSTPKDKYREDYAEFCMNIAAQYFVQFTMYWQINFANEHGPKEEITGELLENIALFIDSTFRTLNTKEEWIDTAFTDQLTANAVALFLGHSVPAEKSFNRFISKATMKATAVVTDDTAALKELRIGEARASEILVIIKAGADGAELMVTGEGDPQKNSKALFDATTAALQNSSAENISVASQWMKAQLDGSKLQSPEATERNQSKAGPWEKARAEAEAKEKARAKAEAEKKARAEAEAKEKARAKAEAEKKARAEAEAKEKSPAKAEAEDELGEHVRLAIQLAVKTELRKKTNKTIFLIIALTLVIFSSVIFFGFEFVRGKTDNSLTDKEFCIAIIAGHRLGQLDPEWRQGHSGWVEATQDAALKRGLNLEKCLLDIYVPSR